MDVFDVSPVTYPAYPQTSVDARAFRSLSGSRISIISQLAILTADFQRDMQRLDRIENLACVVGESERLEMLARLNRCVVIL